MNNVVNIRLSLCM